MTPFAPHCIAIARSTPPSAFWRDVCISFVEGVAVNAMRYGCEVAARVFAKANDFKVIRPHAALVPAQMVERHAVRNWANQQLIRVTMCFYRYCGLLGKHEMPVTARQCAGVIPAGSRLFDIPPEPNVWGIESGQMRCGAATPDAHVVNAAQTVPYTTLIATIDDAVLDGPRHLPVVYHTAPTRAT